MQSKTLAPGGDAEPAQLPGGAAEIRYRGLGTRTARCWRTGLDVSIRPLTEATAIAAQWGDLSRRALVPNIHYEPEYALAADQAFGAGVRLLTVKADDGNKFIAAWPFSLKRTRWGVPLGVLAGWGHPFATSGVPLVDAGHAEQALEALFALPRTFSGLPPRAFLPLTPDEGPFADALAKVRERLGLRLSTGETHERPYLKPGPGVDMLAHLSSGTRSKLRQEYRRLEKLGALTHEIVTSAADIPAAIQDYFDLEARGWKGRAGTAIPTSAAETGFFSQMSSALAQEGRIRVDRLRLGGRTIASSVTYLNGGQAWYGKISFDEEHAKNSPGSQLVLKVTESFLADPTIENVDSCAPAGHPLMRKFWPDRFSLSNRLIELVGGDRLFPLAVQLEALRPRLRDLVKAARRGGGTNRAKKGGD